MSVMRQPLRYRILAFLIADACLVLVLVAIFTGGPSAWKDIDDVSLLSLWRPDTPTDRAATLVRTYACPQCGTKIDWGSETCPQCRWIKTRVPIPPTFP